MDVHEMCITTLLVPPEFPRITDLERTLSVEQAVAAFLALLPSITAWITAEFRQNTNTNNVNGNRGNEKQEYEREYSSRQLDGETSTQFMKRIVKTEFTHVAQVANAARNIKILRDRSRQEGNNMRNGDDHLKGLVRGFMIKGAVRHRSWRDRDVISRFGAENMVIHIGLQVIWVTHVIGLHALALSGWVWLGIVVRIVVRALREGKWEQQAACYEGSSSALTTHQAASARDTVSGTLYM
ncbi:hypothetical protein Tco_0616204 [Tanacetum coccineum]